MPRIVREAEIDWEGTTARGSGIVKALSRSFELLDHRLARRHRPGEDEPGGAPRRRARNLLRDLPGQRARAGWTRHPSACTFAARSRWTRSRIRVTGSSRHAISASALVPGADEATLAAATEAADAGAPYSALIRATATVTVEAVLEEGRS